MPKPIHELKGLYKKAKLSKTGADCICPSCGEKFVKANYQQAFCKTKRGTYCKDFYWNNVTPNKRNNTTRISPANAAYMEGIEERKRQSELYDDDQSWDAHKGSF